MCCNKLVKLALSYSTHHSVEIQAEEWHVRNMPWKQMIHAFSIRITSLVSGRSFVKPARLASR